MGLGVLEDRSMEHVPGTSRYFDDPGRPQVVGPEGTHLKCDTSGPVPIVLVPQPSDDPNDPLNWSLRKRDAIIVVLCIVSIFATSLGSILAANTLTLSLIFERTFTDIALLSGYFLMGTGIAAILCVPSGRVWGKRHLFLLGTILCTVGSAWAGASTGYKSFLWARIIQGMGTAPFETLVNAAVGDLYFVHERGARMALTNLAVFGGAFFTPIVVGKITHTIGWDWSFYLVAIFMGVCLPIVFFFVPETAYCRDAYLNTDMASTDDVRLYHSKETGHTPPSTGSQGSAHGNDPEKTYTESTARRNSELPDRSHRYTKQSFAKSLLPFSGRKTSEPFWKLFLRPFPLFAQPAIFWAMLIQGTMIGWTVFIGVIIGAIFLGPPLFWDEVNTGYAYTGAFIGAILGFLVAGLIADYSARIMTQWNHGIYEPEFRILIVIPQLVFGCAGLYGFGITSSRIAHYHWIWPIFFFALEVMGMVIGTVASSLYIVDAHRDIAIEAFTCLIIFKNFFSFALTFKAYDWIRDHGIHRTFIIIASVQVAICVLSVPMYIFGKRNRSFFHRHNILEMLKLN